MALNGKARTIYSQSIATMGLPRKRNFEDYSLDTERLEHMLSEVLLTA